MRLVREALTLFGPRRRTLYAIGLASLVVAQIEALIFLIIAAVAEAMSREGETLRVELIGTPIELSTRAALAAAAGGAVVCAAGVLLLAAWGARLTTDAERSLRDGVVDRFADADYEQQSSQRAGGLAGRLRLTNAAGRHVGALVTWVRSSATVLVFVLVAVAVDVRAAAVIAIMGLVLGAIIAPFRAATRKFAARVNTIEYEYFQDVTECGEQAANLRVFRAWRAMRDQLAAPSADIAKLRRRMIVLSAGAPTTFQYGGLLIVVGILALVNPGAGNLSTLAAIGLLLLRSLQYGQAVQNSLQVLAETVPVLKSLEEELQPVADARREAVSHRLEHVGLMQLADVRYVYPGASQPALEGITAQFRPGEVVGLVGPSGSGKTTLGQIILRLRHPTSGSMLVDGIPSDKYSDESWFARVTYVPQDVRLLHGSLYENVAYFDERCSRADALSAVRAAGLETLLDDLPHGLDSAIGPGARNLSGGQMQRIGLARALARRPDVVVLDEPTSALDPHNERTVHESITRLRADHGMLVLVIAHRDSTLALCDRLLILDQGRLVREQVQAPPAMAAAQE